MRLLIKGAKQVLQVVNDDRTFLKGPEELKDLALVQAQEGQGLSIAVDKNGLIATIGDDREIAAKFSDSDFDSIIDLSGHDSCVLPGLVDGHTHPVFDGDRVHEFAMKLAGATYMEVHAAGGGINFTVDKTRQASKQTLLNLFQDRLKRMIKSGTTTAECKSGYGLNAETELKMLEVIEEAKTSSPVEISSTFCGAHSVPKGMTAEEATNDVINVQLPLIAEMNKKGQLKVENIDVFCETNVFSVEQTEKILRAGKDIGLRINFHGEELSCLHSAEMGGRLGAEAISHLEEVSDQGIEAMARAGTTAVILPTTAYILRLPNPPVRKMINAGVIVALGSDFNPNAFCLSMPSVMHLACVNLRMSMSEAMAAATINSAHSIGRSKTHGSIQEGKVADFVILDAPRWEHLIYQFAGHDDVIKYVVKRGRVVHQKRE